MDNTQFAKLALRDQLITARGHLPLAAIAERAHLVATSVMERPEMRSAATVAAYVSVGREPGTGPLLEAMRAAGKRVILPILLPDNDLDWAVYTGVEGLASASRGLLEPLSSPLGVDAISTADLVLVPALAIARDGMRLGRGGGSYDRALVRATGTLMGIVNSEEVLDRVPAADHDRRVDLIATPDGVLSATR